MRGTMYCMCFGILCLVASTLALPTIAVPSSPSWNEVEENKEEYLNNVGVVKDKSGYHGSVNAQSSGGSYGKDKDTEDWKDEEEINEYNNYHNHVSNELEDEEVEIEEVEGEEVDDDEVENEEIEIQEEDDEDDSSYENDDKYSKFEKNVIIKWKIPTSFLLNSLFANISPELRAPSPYLYQPFRFPIQNVPYPGIVNY